MAPRKCIFCQIVEKEDPKTRIIYASPEEENEPLVVFRDIKPAATHHYLVCTKEHIKDAKALRHKHVELVEKMVATAKQVLQDQGGDLADASFGFHWPPFTVISHLHLHVISPKCEMGFISRWMFRDNSMWHVSPEYVINRLKDMPVEESKH